MTEFNLYETVQFNCWNPKGKFVLLFEQILGKQGVTYINIQKDKSLVKLYSFMIQRQKYTFTTCDKDMEGMVLVNSCCRCQQKLVIDVLVNIQLFPYKLNNLGNLNDCKYLASYFHTNQTILKIPINSIGKTNLLYFSVMCVCL